ARAQQKSHTRLVKRERERDGAREREGKSERRREREWGERVRGRERERERVRGRERWGRGGENEREKERERETHILQCLCIPFCVGDDTLGPTCHNVGTRSGVRLDTDPLSPSLPPPLL